MSGRMILVLVVAALVGGNAYVQSVLHHSKAGRAVVRVFAASQHGNGGISSGHTPPRHARCHLKGTGNFVRPDDRCTPGTFIAISKAQACTHKERPSLSTSKKRSIIRQYGFSSWSGRDGEIDHRVPFFLGGTTEEDNLWPQPGKRPNAKDLVESRVYRHVCTKGTMSVEQAVAAFRHDWTTIR